MSTNELDALIVRNLRDLDIASKRLLVDVEERIAKAFNGAADSWTRTHGWKGEFNWDGPLWLAPGDWKKSPGTKDDDWLGWFCLDAGFGDDRDPMIQGQDVFWLTRLCGLGQGIICFRWERGDLGASKTKWKKFAQPYIESIQKTGFIYDDSLGLFFSKLLVDPAALATALAEDEIEPALKPLASALDRLLAAKPTFDVILKEARKQFAGGL